MLFDEVLIWFVSSMVSCFCGTNGVLKQSLLLDILALLGDDNVVLLARHSTTLLQTEIPQQLFGGLA